MMWIKSIYTIAIVLVAGYFSPVAHAQYTEDRYSVGYGSSSGSGKKNVSIVTNVQLKGGYEVLRFSQGSGVSFTGLTYGAAFEPIIRLNSINLGIHISYMGGTFENSNNTALRNEEISSTDLQFTLRIYSGFLMVGVGPALRFLTLTSIQGSSTATTKYGAYGMRAEVGLHFVFFKHLTLTPMLQYESLWASPSTGTGQLRVNSYAPLLSIGFVF